MDRYHSAAYGICRPGLAGEKARSRHADPREELAERPDDPFTCSIWERSPIERNEWNDALGYLKHSLAGSAPTDSISRKLFALIARAHQMLGDSQRRLEDLCRRPFARF